MRSIPTAAALLALFLSSGCATTSVMQESEALERRGNWQRAFAVVNAAYEEQVAAGDVSPRLAQARERLLREAMRDRAQSLIFHEQEGEALALLARLEALDPNFRDLDRLRRHAFHKQAKQLVVEGDGLLSQQEFQGAMEKYLESQRIVPGFELAENGMERVKDELARMDAVAQRQFLQAVRKYPEFRHIEVSWHAEAVLRNTPDPADERRVNAQRLRDDARSERARAKVAEAVACERLDKFGAALVLYRQARKLDAELDGVQQSIERMNSELAALGLIESAQLIMRNGEFTEARELLELAFEKSELSRGAISELMIQNRKLQAAAEYRAARDFEVMGKKSEALAAFEALAEQWPDGFEDEAARIDALRVDIQGAQEEWQAALDAEAAGDLEKALDHFVNAERFYEQWRDGEAQIERLRAAIAERGAEASGGEGGS